MGFVTFSDKATAVAAINGLNGQYVMEGCDRWLSALQNQRSQNMGRTDLLRTAVIQWLKPHYLIVCICHHILEVSIHRFLARLLRLHLHIQIRKICLIVIGVSIYLLMAIHTTIIV